MYTAIVQESWPGEFEINPAYKQNTGNHKLMVKGQTVLAFNRNRFRAAKNFVLHILLYGRI